ncbi:MAG: DUF3850 domain-containing protein [archaeon]
MTKITKKCEKIWFDKILTGDKKFEIRLADWNIEKGDTLILNEVVDGKETGRTLSKKVSIVLKTKEMPYYTQEEVGKYGYQVIGWTD